MSNNVELDKINEKYKKLQNKYGDKNLDAILNGGLSINPDLCLIFMNPTGKNIASSKSWHGIKGPWVGTKPIWKILNELNLIDDDICLEIQNKKPLDWTPEFALKLYNHIENKKIYITNLGKCTQIDARPLKDSQFKEYLNLLDKEIDVVKPKKIICFGNQVSSLFLNKKISVSEVRRMKFEKKIKGNSYIVYSVYYPVGNGRFNIDKVMEDIPYILNE
ncbi:MAG TPA: uracil-DNA glycosylase family protein [Bacilli bacterium]|nr:uracil-DNA glycosylase family protein [Bacilli bacterium]